MIIKTNKTIGSMIKFVIAILLVALGPAMGSLMSCKSQGNPSQQPSTPRERAPLIEEAGVTRPVVEAKEDYRIKAGDIIDVTVDRAPELSGMFRVTASGTINLDYLGRILVQDKTQEELSRDIAKDLRGRYLKNPRVIVKVTQINSQVFFIQGAVNKPGTYQIEGRPSLMKLITVAGGLKENYGTTAFIIREMKRPAVDAAKVEGGSAITPQSSPTGATVQPIGPVDDEDERYELIRVNINGLFRGDFDKNMYVDPGSIIHIPSSEVFFVAGEVKAPGSFAYRDGTTLRQAISLAQGTTFKAAGSRGLIFREHPITRKREEVKVDISAVMSGKVDDIQIMPNDVIIVPNSRMKSVGGTILMTLGTSAIRLPGY